MARKYTRTGDWAGQEPLRRCEICNRKYKHAWRRICPNCRRIIALEAEKLREDWVKEHMEELERRAAEGKPLFGEEE